MITIGDTLRVEHVHLNAAADSPEAAVDLVAASLRSHPAVLDWDKLSLALHQASPCAAERGCDFGICIPHARSSAVSAMVMSVGRFDPGLSFEGCFQPIRYVFCIGLRVCLDSLWVGGPSLAGSSPRVLSGGSRSERCKGADGAPVKKMVCLPNSNPAGFVCPLDIH